MKNNYELRNFEAIEVKSYDKEKEDKRMVITGKPILFESKTILYEDDMFRFEEIISADALNDVDLKNVKLLMDHGKTSMIPLATTKNKTLELEVKEDGLHFEAELNENISTHKEAYELVRNQYCDEMSFAFQAKDEDIQTRYENEKEVITRRINKFEAVREISIVNWGAYSDTSVEARSEEDAKSKIEKIREEREERKSEKRNEKIKEIEKLL